MNSSPASLSLPSLPLAVHTGFAGARRWWPVGSTADPAAQQAVAALLEAALAGLPEALGLSSQHFVVGVSQMAVGGDMLFTETCASLGWGQRVLLPQQRDDYLSAEGSKGDDFSPKQREQARHYLQLPHIIEERVVSDAETRADRFEDTNLAILAASDVLVCLCRDDQVSRVGGTLQLMKRAQARHIPVLELRLRWRDDGSPELEQHWHTKGAARFVPPRLPSTLHSPTIMLALPPRQWPDLQDYATALKTQCSDRAKGQRLGFRWSAGVVVGTHLGATLLASLMVAQLIFMGSAWLVLALIAEIGLLTWGFLIHRQLHKVRHTEDWAMARLCAELCRSTRELGRLYGSLSFLLALPFPSELRPLLRTLEVLQLRSRRGAQQEDWRTDLQRYVTQRLTGSSHLTGQIAYYGHEQRRATALAHGAARAFTWLSLAAIATTTIKLALKLLSVDIGHQGGWMGVVAIMLPVMAVGGMSIAAALDAEARDHTFAQMRDFLTAQVQRLTQAASQREAMALAVEAETRLLSETLTWYARRVYTGIA